MDEMDRIRRFLRAVRGRALLAAGLRAGSLTAAALLGFLLLLAAAAVRIGPAAFWPTVTGTVLLLVTGVGVTLALIAPRRRLRDERAVAMYVGRRHPPLASDLLSAVELAVPEGRRVPHHGSASIARAFHGTVAEAVAPLDPRRVVPLREVRPAALALLAVALLLIGGLTWTPAVRRGMELLVRHPTRFEGAAVSREPLVGDVRLVYTPPAYTGLPRRVVEGSTGDIVALKGTKVDLETTPLRSAREAVLLFGDDGEGGEQPARLEDGKLRATLTVREAGSYRVWLAPLIGRPVREARPHRIVVEPDRPPEVEILGPADRLELQSPRPVEVGFNARDDFGLATVELVWRVDDGPEHRQKLRDAGGARAANGKTVFEPPGAELRPGARVAYRIEAKDRDDVSGAKAGSSRTLYLVIHNPRENLDEQLARERELLDRLLGTLADRLEMTDAASATSGALAHLQTWLTVHEGEEAHLALLGRLVDESKRAGTASKALIAALSGIGDRLGKQMREEKTLIAALRGKADEGTLSSSHFTRLEASGVKHVQELEQAVLQLDDLIGRQRLEDLAQMGRELTQAFKRLQDLLQRYGATKDEALRRQLEREMRDLKARIEELARKIAEVKARNEVPSEWQNMPDMKEALEKANRLDQLMEKGDPKSMEQALAELGQTLEKLQSMLERNASDFGGERFAQENRAASEMMKKLGDLEGDQRALAGDSQSLAGELDAEHEKRMQGQIKELLERAEEKAEALRKKLQAAAPRELGETGEDELRRAQEAAKQLRQLIPSKELGEAKKETDRIGGSLRRVRRQAEERQGRRPSPRMESFAGEMGEAQKLAEELAADLQRLMPRPEEMMSPEQRERSRGMGERQGSLEQRTRELAEELGKKAGQVPGAELAGEELKGIGEQMQGASQDLQRGSAKEGASKAQEAAERLAKLRNGMSQRQMSRGQQQREPVRIPGADESKAPREWRQELLEAMREKAPSKFREEVRRYYEELVK